MENILTAGLGEKMPAYTFECENCSKVFERVCSMKDYTGKAKCPLCNSKKTFRRYVDDVATLNGSVKKADSELKTIGDLANRNRDRMTEDHKIALHQKHNSYREDAPELPKGMSRLNKDDKPHKNFLRRLK